MTGRVATFARARLASRSLTAMTLLSALLALALTLGLRALEGGPSASPEGAAQQTGGSLARLSGEARASLSAAIGASNRGYHFTAAAGVFRAVNRSQHLAIAAGSDGVLLRTGAMRLGVGLPALSYDGKRASSRDAQLTRAANRVTYTSEGIRSFYVNGPLGVEQGFTLAASVPGRARPVPTEVTVQMALSGNARASLTDQGRAIDFTAAGSSLRYGELRVSDADGRRLASSFALVGRRLQLRIDTRGARFPLHVDPFVANPQVEIPELKLKREGEDTTAAFGEHAGLSVALSANGTTAVVGAPDADEGQGSVWVYTRPENSNQFGTGVRLQVSVPQGAQAGQCLEEQAVEEEEVDECGFGRSVAVSADGDTVLIGAPLQQQETGGVEKPGAGAAWVFTRTEDGWQPTELASPTPIAEGHFGRSVALSANGETALVGAPGERFDQGHAWIFQVVGSKWTAQENAPLEGGGEVGEKEHFGESVALAGDGDVALVGSPASKRFKGTAWLFERDAPESMEWRRLEHVSDDKLTQGAGLAGEGEQGTGHFGFSVALSEDGATALVGAPFAEGATGGPRTGQAWVFERQPGTSEWSEEATRRGEDEKEEFGYSVAVLGDGQGDMIGAPDAHGSHGAVYLWEPTTTSTLKELTGKEHEDKFPWEERGAGHFGKSVATTPDGDLQLVGTPAENKGEGWAYVFGNGPVITGVNPDHGPKTGGTEVVITGQHINEARAVTFGGTPVVFKLTTTGSGKESISVVSPPGGSVEAVQIKVTTPFGESEAPFLYQEEGETGGKRGGGGGGGGGGGTTPPGGGTNPPGEGTTKEVTSLNSTVSSTNNSGVEQVLGLGPIVSAACAVSATSPKIAVQAHGASALVRLRGSGTANCRGHVTLSVKVKAKAAKGKHAKTKTKQIGTANFVVTAGRTVLVKVKLNALGRALLAAGHGHLKATLVVLRSSPAPKVARVSSVRLARQRPSKPKSQHGR